MSADRLTGKSWATRSEVWARRGMAATSQPLATQAALRILVEGGSAVDAAIAANACLGLMEPTGCGLGGDLFAIVWDAESHSLIGLNACGRSPLGLSCDHLLHHLGKDHPARLPSLGPLTITVPGVVDGWASLHARFGRASWASLLTPAREYAEEGFPVSELIAAHWRASLASRKIFPGFVDTFTFDGKRTPDVGETWRNPALANTLGHLSREGPRSFYEGELAQAMVRALEKSGSFLRESDFRNHQSDWVDPVCVDYRGVQVWELPPPGQGMAALQMLRLLEDFPLSGMGFGSAEYIHCFVEAKKLAYADRARFYADPAFSKIPVEHLLSRSYASQRRSLIDHNRAALSVEAGPAILEKGDTVYLATADSRGNMVSLIQSNFWGMGSGVAVPELGFGFQNRGCSFALQNGHANLYAAGKRPFHTIIPGFVTRDGEPWIAFGVMGGATQPQAHVQILCNLLDFGMNLQEAGDAPRILHSGSGEPDGTPAATNGGWVSLETGIPWETVRTLMGMGHDVRWNAGDFGGYQAVAWESSKSAFRAASESRKDGQAAGW